MGSLNSFRHLCTSYLQQANELVICVTMEGQLFGSSLSHLQLSASLFKKDLPHSLSSSHAFKKMSGGLSVTDIL